MAGSKSPTSSTPFDAFRVFTRHRLRAKVDFEDFSSTCSAWARFAGPLQDNDGASEEVESGGMGYGGTGGGASESSEEVYQWCKDPRLGALGQRGLFPLHSTRECFSIQHSAFSIQHSAFSIQHSAFSIQHSAFSIQHVVIIASEGRGSERGK